MYGGIKMQIKSSSFPSIEQVTGQYLTKTKNTDGKSEQASFLEILQQTQSNIKSSPTDATQELKFSKHASERLMDRNISLTDEQLQRLEDGAQKASSKGIKESLVLLDNLAFIVNTKNNTVVTAMNQSSDAENIYTNIDGAVII